MALHYSKLNAFQAGEYEVCRLENFGTGVLSAFLGQAAGTGRKLRWHGLAAVGLTFFAGFQVAISRLKVADAERVAVYHCILQRSELDKSLPSAAMDSW